MDTVGDEERWAKNDWKILSCNEERWVNVFTLPLSQISNEMNQECKNKNECLVLQRGKDAKGPQNVRISGRCKEEWIRMMEKPIVLISQ